MKKDITEYEEASEVKKYIKCANCDETWEQRKPWVKGKRSINVLALDAELRKIDSYGRGYTTKRFGRSLWKHDTYCFYAPEFEDYCQECYDELFEPTSAAMEVEEEEYYVEEKVRTEYICDFCNGNMGEKSDHEVYVNPYIKIVTRGANIASRHDKEVTKEFPGFGNTFSPSSTTSTSSTVGEELDCCDACADSIFGTSFSATIMSRGDDDSESGFWARLLGF